MATAIGALFADIGANSAAFAADMGKAERALKSGSGKMNRSLGRLDKGFFRVRKGIDAKVKSLFSMKGAIVSVVGGAGLGLLIKRALDTGDTIAKVADSIGVSTDFLQEYRFAAGLAGIETGNFDSALQAAAKRVGEARAGTGTLITILKKMDPALLAAVQGAKSMDQAMDLIIKKGASMSNQLDRAALFAAAFGRTAGVQMTNLIRKGADEIDRMRERARELGLVLNESLLRGAEEAKDKLSILGQVLSTTVTQAILENADAIATLATEFTDAIPKIIGAVRTFGEFVGLLDKRPAGTLEVLNQVNDEITRVTRMTRGGRGGKRLLAIDEDIAGMLGIEKGILGGFAADIDEVIPKLIELRQTLIDALVAEGEVREGAKNAASAAEAINQALERRMALNRWHLQNQKSRIEGERQLAAAAAKTETANAWLDQAAKKWAVLKGEINKSAEATDEVAFAGDRMGDAVGRNLLSIINRTNTAADAVRNLALEFGNAVLQEALIGPLSSRAGGFFRNLLGFQHGGTVTAGGSGGPDSQIVGPFKVSPRERITFTPPGQASPARGGGGTTIVYNIDARGAEAGAVQRIEQVLRAHIQATPSIAIASVHNFGNRNA